MNDLLATPDSPAASFKAKPGSEKKPKKKGKPGNLILILLIIGAVGLFAWAEQSRRSTARQLADTQRQLEEIQAASQQSNESVAAEILEKVKLLVDIPLDPQPTVAKINDIERLREANEFFNVAENGDYMIITGNRVLLYNEERNVVLDVAPFSINRTENQEGESPAPSPAAGQQQSNPSAPAGPGSPPEGEQ